MTQTALKDETVSRVTVDILGERFTIKGEEDPGYIAEVARVVDSRMRHIRASGRSDATKYRAAILAAVNLADELLQERKRRINESENPEVVRRTHQLITLLDEGLVGDLVE